MANQGFNPASCFSIKSIKVSTTLGSARVLTSPSWSASPEDIFLNTRRRIFPLLV
jgi:hypothetical protein